MGVSAHNGRLVRRYDDELLWIEPWGSGLRVRATCRSGIREDHNWALLPQNSANAHISANGDDGSIAHGDIVARVHHRGQISFFNAKGAPLLEERWRTRTSGSLFSSIEIRGRELRPVAGDLFRITVRFESHDDERIFGMGQYQDGRLNLKGSALELAHRNSQASVPFFLSSRGYGLLWNNPAIGRATFAANLTELVAEQSSQLDYWITTGDTPASIEERYASVTGTVPMMPEFAMGFWQCKLRYRTQEELLWVAREYKRRGLPISVIVCDFFHWPLQGDWKFDPRLWPDPEAMVKELRSMGIELMVSVWPTVDKKSANFEPMREAGLLTRVDRGIRTTMDFMGVTVFFDATNPDARAFVWNRVSENYYRKGIRVFWLDEAEPEYSVYDFDNYRYHLGSDMEVGNIYPVGYAQAFYDGMRAEGQKEVINLLRCAWAGSQRYGALVWSGDIDCTFDTLRRQLAAGLNMGIAGIPWWTTDIGGFEGGDPDDPAYRELLIRWFQWGAFCPVFRLHGHRVHREQPASLEDFLLSGGPNEVWSYGDEAYGILVKYLRLRERLRPYIVRMMRQAHEKGTPVMRPLFYDFPSDDRAWEQEEQYMFGPDLLVAPVMHPGMRRRTVYLPTGAQWTEAETGASHAGGQTVDVEAPLDRIPVFVRDDARIPVRE
ncbi:MAG TPA: glycoside hydrolase family 31 protein [Spirochaetia bacterium]|nr:glycoside hydrolase family 31 protein [Spirochaetia bacterium]